MKSLLFSIQENYISTDLSVGWINQELILPYYRYIWNMSERINRVKEVLVIKGMIQKELANQLGEIPNTITSICNNKSQPHLKDLKPIAEILNVDIRELLDSTK